MNAVISTNERAWTLTGHVTFKLHYDQIYQMKTTIDLTLENSFAKVETTTTNRSHKNSYTKNLQAKNYSNRNNFHFAPL